jgi:hypothetical protein
LPPTTASTTAIAPPRRGWSGRRGPGARGGARRYGKTAHPASSGTAYTALITILLLKGEEQGWEYWRQFNANVWQYTKSGAAPAQHVSQGEAMTLSDRIVVMNKGRIMQIGTAHEIYRRRANAFVADFIGKATFLPAHVVGAFPGHLDLEVLGRSLSIQLSDGAPHVGERATLPVRPEAMILDRGGDGYPGRVCRTAYLGSIVEYDVEVTGAVLSLTQHDPRQVYPVGTEVRVQLVKDALYLLPDELRET